MKNSSGQDESCVERVYKDVLTKPLYQVLTKPHFHAFNAFRTCSIFTVTDAILPSIRNLQIRSDDRQQYALHICCI